MAPGVDTRIVANTTDTFHVVMPPDPNTEVSDEILSTVAGGSTAGTASSLGSIACVSLASCFSSAGSAGSAGPPGG